MIVYPPFASKGGAQLQTLYRKVRVAATALITLKPFNLTGLQVILMAGLQGVGKTTACGKLALALQKRNKRVLLVATDVYRPAAIDQLVTLGQRIQVSPSRVQAAFPLKHHPW